MGKEKKVENVNVAESKVMTVAERALQLGMANLKVEQPSKVQKDRFPNTLANVSFDLLINSQVTTVDDAGNEQVDRINIRGIKLVRTDMGELRVYTPRINNFYPISTLGAERNKFLFEVYEQASKRWAMLPELPDINDEEIQVADEVMA